MVRPIDDPTEYPECSKCHAELEWEECHEGCEDGWFYPGEDDPIQYDPDEAHACHLCSGKGGWWWCPSCSSVAVAEQRGTQ